MGHLRASATKAGLTLSIPDAHVAQTAVDLEGTVWSRNTVFEKLADKSLVRAFRP